MRHAARLGMALFATAMALTFAAPGHAGKPALSRFEFREMHMGSEFKLLLYCPDGATARRASRAAFDRIAALDRSLSDYDPDSELMRLCNRAGGPPVAVSDDLFRVLERSQEISSRSDGAFDATVGPVVRLWRRTRRNRLLPEPETLARALALVGFAKVKLDAKARTVQLLKPGMKLDLGGIAKGYASGEAIATLKREGVDRALVAGAGDVVVSGPPPGTEGWTVGIAPLEAPGGSEPSRRLLLRDAAVSTSGDAERFVEIGGVRYSHIVNPKTGIGLVDRVSVTVVARDGATADALATACCVLGPDRGLKLADEIEGAAALFVRAGETMETTRFQEIPEAPAIPRASP